MAVTKVIFAIILLVSWEILAKMRVFGPNSELLFPSLESIGAAFVRNFTVGYAGMTLWVYIGNSMKLLMEGLLIGVLLAFVFSGISMISAVFYDVYDFIVMLCDLLPGVTLLPVIMIIVGIKPQVIVFLVVHAVIWPMSKNLLDGFKNVPRIYIEAGKNIGLDRISLLIYVYIPAAASHIMSGLKVGWARAWRGLLSAEMIFGLASRPGIGLFINQMRANMNNSEMYATLIVIVMIGIIVQYAILEPIEKKTVKRWGMAK